MALLLRDQAGGSIARLLPVDQLVPEYYARWRPVVGAAIEFVLSRLSEKRLAAKLAEQLALPPDCPVPVRLLKLLSRMPGFQKLGQVLARHPRLAQPLREALSQLENGMSDMTARSVHAIIRRELGAKLRKYRVKTDPAILCEASVSAIVRFTWRDPAGGKAASGVFKVLKPYVPRCFSEDLDLLQRLSEFIAADRGYGFAARPVAEMVADVRLLLEHELDFQGEQATLRDALESYRLTLGVRVPRLIEPLCTPRITAMTWESGVKVTEAFPRQPYRRRAVAEQLIEAVIAVPLLSRERETVLHADPHAGNLLYDEERRELVILDWALTQKLTRETRRQLAMLMIMTMLRNASGVAAAIGRLTSDGERSDPRKTRLIESMASEFFERIPPGRAPGSSDALKLLDQIALAGVRFPAELAMFQKALFTLEGVLHDIAGSKVAISGVLVRDFVLRGLASLGWNTPPLSISDLAALQRSALQYPVRWGASVLRSAIAPAEHR